ncbi:hypothetical protein VOLCADRAFT_100443 [Volvox carteri f. nagariensis]|uniref:Uncharacterized protein n=1 Tax=Volvox carteri f. nagariensis TaxID=3068 RepID=D8UK80_VOLCA|nr:uncharacterized protein VOLCADRAFT_100443 [Volvox carteri f. nagariensis]EFJ39858.1 hypothetical protein VOLCADRAFT_100443 [Volvox carteri f. nagariensis]|eukprot:XP_002959064.1 hypothetical protein VOLCADRAFT_100443 [Volvox carteri f. nagariensis]
MQPYAALPLLLFILGTFISFVASARIPIHYKDQARHVLKADLDGTDAVTTEVTYLMDAAAAALYEAALLEEASSVAPWLLPPELLPGVAYFDAESGVTLEGRCRLLRQGGAPAAVSFDGTSCTVTLDDYLSLEPAWEAAFWSPDFTAVWVMMQAEDARPKAFSFEGMLQCAVEDNASAASSGRGLPPLPSKQWTMEALSKSTDEATGVVTQKAVEESEVRDLATFYGSRFGWRQELQQAQR